MKLSVSGHPKVHLTFALDNTEVTLANGSWHGIIFGHVRDYVVSLDRNVDMLRVMSDTSQQNTTIDPFSDFKCRPLAFSP